VIMLFEVLVGALSAWWLAGETLGLREWLGGAMIIGGGLVAAADPRPAGASSGRAPDRDPHLLGDPGR